MASRLALILRLRESDERQAQLALAQRRGALADARAALERAEARVAALVRPTPPPPSRVGIRAGRLAAQDRFAARARRDLDEARAVEAQARRAVAAAEAACEQARAALELACRRRQRTRQAVDEAARKAALERLRREERAQEELTAAKPRR